MCFKLSLSQICQDEGKWWRIDIIPLRCHSIKYIIKISLPIVQLTSSCANSKTAQFFVGHKKYTDHLVYADDTKNRRHVYKKPYMRHL